MHFSVVIVQQEVFLNSVLHVLSLLRTSAYGKTEFIVMSEYISHTVLPSFHSGFASLLNWAAYASQYILNLRVVWSIVNTFILISIKYSCVFPIMASSYWNSEMDYIQKYWFSEFQDTPKLFCCCLTNRHEKGKKRNKETSAFFFF